MDVDATAKNLAGRGGDMIEGDDAALPLAYGSDTLELMVRDPTWACAYWDMSVDRLTMAVGRCGREEGFLRLIDVPSGHLVAEHAVSLQRGNLGLALPQADRSYRAELALMCDYSWVILARSGVVHAPPTAPRSAPANGLALGREGNIHHLTRTPGSSQALMSTRTPSVVD